MEGVVTIDTRKDRGFFRQRSVLVTGCTGFLGAWLAERLVDLGANVVGLVRDHVPGSRLWQVASAGGMALVSGDIRDRDTLERVLGEYEVETVFHLAAQTIVGIANANPVSTFESNIAGAWNVYEAARRSPRVRRIVLASSDKAYGSHGGAQYSETMALQGEHPYDVSKSCADLIARSYYVTYRLPIAITRCANLYGGGDLNWNRLVPGVIRDVVSGRRPVIRSDGTLVRDYLYVEDAVEAYLHTAEAMDDPAIHGEAFNFSTENQMSVLDLVRRILGQMGSSLEPNVRGEATHEIPHQSLSAEKARRVLAWEPTFGLDIGLERTIAWYRDFLERAPGAPGATGATGTFRG